MTTDSDPPLPTRDEIALECDDGRENLDGLRAIERFYGKTLAEAEELFAEGAREDISFSYTENLLWMEPVGFRFYIQAAIRFALSERATGESDLISSLAGTISLWHEQHPGELRPCARLLADFCTAVVEQFDRYDASPHIYVGLRQEYQQLADLFTRLSTEPENA